MSNREIILEREKEKNLDIGFGKFLISAKAMTEPNVKTAGHMVEYDDAQGGALVPEEYDKIILSYAVENSIVRPRAQIFKATSDSLKIPRLVDSDRSANMFGGITFSWVEEKGDKDAAKSKPETGQLEFTQKKLVGCVWCSNELENDIESFGRFMRRSFGKALGFVQDYHFLHGTGVGQPLGILNSTAIQLVARAEAGAVEIADLGGMVRLLCADSWQDPGTVWIFNSDIMADYFQTSALVGVSPVAVLNLNEGKILDKPVIISSLAESLGNIGDAMLLNLSYYAICDRSLAISASMHQNKSGRGYLTNETMWKIVWRGDGQPIVDNPITPRIGINQVSPFVALGHFIS